MEFHLNRKCMGLWAFIRLLTFEKQFSLFMLLRTLENEQIMEKEDM
jgi:hypothetical protein